MATTHPVQITIGATLAASLGAAVSGAQAQLGRLGAALSALNSRRIDIQQLEKLRAQATESAAAVQAAQQRVAAAQEAIAARGGQATARQTRELERAQGVLARAEQAYQRNQTAIEQLSASLERAGVNTRALGSETARLGAQYETLRTRTEALTQAQQAHAANLEQRSAYRAQLMDAVALSAALGAPIRVAMRFEQAMAEVGAVSRASSEDLSRLTAQARELGAKTNWSASQAADAMKFLAMAGFSTEQTLAAMPGMLNLASAGAIDLGRAADIASNILSGFNLDASEMGRVGDVLTNTFTASNTSLEMLGESMKYVAPVAAATGTSLETAAAMVGKLGDAGIQSSQAGTALRAILNRIAAPSDKAAELFAKIGVATRDAAGNMRPVVEVMADIARATQMLGTAERSEVISTLFGLEAASAATVLMNQAASGSLQTFAESLREAGSATRVAERQNETATGAMKRLGSAIESMAISIGNVLLPPLASLADRAAVVIGALSNWADRHPLLTQVVMGTAAAAIALKIATIGIGYAWTFVKGPILAAGVAIQSARAGLALLQAQAVATGASAAAMSPLALLWGRIKTGAAGIVAPIGAATTAMRAMIPTVTTMGAALLANPITWIVAGIGAAVAGLALAIRKYWDPLVAYVSGVWEGIRSATAPAIESISTALAPLAPVGEAIGSVFGVIADGVSRVISWFGELLTPVTLTQGEFESISASGRSLGEVIGSVLAAAFTALTMPMQAVGTVAGWVIEGFRQIAAFSPLAALPSAWQAASNFFGALWQQIISGAQTAIQQVTSALGSLAPVQAIQQMIGSIVQTLSQLPSQMISIGASIIDGLVCGIKQAAQGAIDAVGSMAASVCDRFKSMLGIHSPSQVFAALGSAISMGLAQGVVASAPEVLAEVGQLAQSIAQIPMTMAEPQRRQVESAWQPSLTARPTSLASMASAPSLPTPMPVAPGAGTTIHYAPQITIHTAPQMGGIGGGDPQALANLIESRLRQMTRERFGRPTHALYD